MLLRDLLSRGPEISEEVNQAIENGDFASLAGDSELVSDLDNVRRQILDDLLPDATNLLADPERLAEEAQGFAAAAPSIAQDASAAVPGAVSALSSLLSDPARAAALVQQEASNVFSRTPEGLAMPPYRVLKSGDGYELREYAAVDVVRTDVAVSAGGGASSGSTSVNLSPPAIASYNALLSYFLGGNANGQALDITSPVRIDEPSSPSAAKFRGVAMSFMLSSGLNRATSPAPSSGSVRIEQRGVETLAVASFGGIATPGEVRRSLSKLREALRYANIEEGDEDFYSLLQYNPPYTLPWLRRNEVAVPIRMPSGEGASPAAASEAGAVEAPDGEDPDGAESADGDEFGGAPSD